MNPIRKTEIPFCEGRKLVPISPMASKVLEDVFKDLEFLNTQLLPFLRGNGIDHIKTNRLYQYAEDHSCFVGGDKIEVRVMSHPELMTFTGRKVNFNREAFKEWFNATEEGKAQKAFRESMTNAEVQLLAMQR